MAVQFRGGGGGEGKELVIKKKVTYFGIFIHNTIERTAARGSILRVILKALNKYTLAYFVHIKYEACGFVFYSG